MAVKLHFTTPKDGRAPLAYALVEGNIVFKATLADREIWAILDTGAERSIVDVGFAGQARLTVGPPEGTIRTSTGPVPSAG